MPKKVDTIYVNKMLHLRQVSELLNIPFELLQLLNPQYKKDIIPALPDQPLPLYLPIEYISSFIALGDSIYKYKDSLFFKTIRPSEYVANSYGNMQEVAIYHKVKSGETLHTIARKYRVSAKDIASWNHISTKKPLKVGKTIVIYVLRKKEEPKSPSNSTDVSRLVPLNSADSIAQPPITNNTPQAHIVRQGDTLFSIAKQYNVSIEELCKINNISNSSHIKVGQKLLLPNK